MVDQQIADYVIGVLKCAEERKRVNRRLTVTINRQLRNRRLKLI